MPNMSTPIPTFPHYKGEEDEIKNRVPKWRAKQIGYLGLKTKFINSKEQDIFHSIGVIYTFFKLFGREILGKWSAGKRMMVNLYSS